MTFLALAFAQLTWLATTASADIAGKTYVDYRNVNAAATQRLRFMAGPDLGPVSTEIHYELSARSNGEVAGGWDRLNLKWGNWTVGRDAVAFGVGRIWSPNDLLEPFAPTEIDKDYKTGLDLVRYDQALGQTSGLTLVYAPLRDTAGSFLGRLRLPLGNYSASLIAGRLDTNSTLGLTFDGPLGGAGLRGSLNCLTSPEGSSAYKFILGSDYLFPNDLYVLSEYYYDQGRHYLALGYSLDFWSLWTTTGYVLGNLNDGSRLYWEEIDYSLSDESSLKAGAFIPAGGSATEYGAAGPLAYALLSVYL